jgi:DNA-binding NarL/FixJ family response regulator
MAPNGIEATTEIVRHCPNTKVVVLSGYDDEVSVMNAIKAGARGYILKRASLTDMLEAIRTVARGGSYLSPQVSDRLLRRIQTGNTSTSNSPMLQGLSPREVQVLRLVAEGKSSKEIAGVLNLELETVRSYRKTMMKKLGVNNAATLTKVAVQAGLTPVEARS